MTTTNYKPRLDHSRAVTRFGRGVFLWGDVMRIEIQFSGYLPCHVDLDDPASVDVFEHIDDPVAAADIIRAALMSDPDPTGWCHGEAAGEEFQVRELFVDSNGNTIRLDPEHPDKLQVVRLVDGSDGQSYHGGKGYVVETSDPSGCFGDDQCPSSYGRPCCCWFGPGERHPDAESALAAIRSGGY